MFPLIPLTRFIVKRTLFYGTVPVLIVIALTLFPVLASADEDPCREKGIYIGNQTVLNVWYKRDGGTCTIWHRNHILVMKPEETLIIYRDLACETGYCSNNPNYDAYKSVDADQDCRVKILPDCKLSDM